MRATKKQMKGGGTVKISIKDKYHPLGRAIQIIEVSDWMNKKLSTISSNIAEQLCSTFSLPCSRFIKQMVRYGSFAIIPVLRDQLLNGDIASSMLSTFIWIICSSTFHQVLVLAFGLYDVHDEDYLDKEAATALLSDVLLDEDHVTSDKGNEMIKVTEIVDELFKYADAKNATVATQERRRSLIIGNENVVPEVIAKLTTETGDPEDDPTLDQSLKREDSFSRRERQSFPDNKPRTNFFPSSSSRAPTREVSVFRRTSAIFQRASVVFRRRSVTDGCPFGVNSATFLKFFVKKKTGVLWQLQMLQDKLQAASFGVKAWSGVREWTVKHNFHGLDASGTRLRELLRSVGFELAKYLSMKNHRPLLTVPIPPAPGISPPGSSPASPDPDESIPVPSYTDDQPTEPPIQRIPLPPAEPAVRPACNTEYKMGEIMDETSEKKIGVNSSGSYESFQDSPDERQRSKRSDIGCPSDISVLVNADSLAADSIDNSDHSCDSGSDVDISGRKKKKKGAMKVITNMIIAGRKTFWS